MKNIILIDVLYLLFYRFFATKKWFSFSNAKEYNTIKDNEKYDWIKNEIFMDKYKKMLFLSIIKIIGTEIYENSIVIFCMDEKNDVWRDQIMDTYKNERIDLSIKNNFKPIFEYMINYYINTIIDNKIYHKIEHKKCEADDIIGTITLHCKKYYKNTKIYIISNDKDYLQLGRKNVYFISLNKKQINITIKHAQNILHEKIIMGDKTDNIKGIFYKTKIKNKKDLIENKKKLFSFLDNNILIKKKYLLNQKLINFDFIPKNLKKEIIILFEKIIVICNKNT
jgi:5'-3' exonuclease